MSNGRGLASYQQNEPPANFANSRQHVRGTGRVVNRPHARQRDHQHRVGCCTGCGRRPKRRPPEISEPFRPDELNAVLQQYGIFNEHHQQYLPNAWLGPLNQGQSVPGGHHPTSSLDTHGVGGSSDLRSRTTNQPSAYHLPLSVQLPPMQQPQPPPNLGPSLPNQTSRTTGDPSTTRLLSTGSQLSPLAFSLSAELASVGKHRFRLTYVTDRLLIVHYPTDAQESDYNEGARWLCQAFERRYGSKYRIFNLSGFTKELHLTSHSPVIDLFWPGSLAPGLEQLVTAIDQLDYWLHNHDNGYSRETNEECRLQGDVLHGSKQQVDRVAVLHCTGPRSLLATYLAVYICQSQARFGPLSGQRPGSPTARGLEWTENRFKRFQNELVLGHMILKRFYEDNLARELSPSQKRYVNYFSGLVTGSLILQDRLVHLHAVAYRNPSRGRYFSSAPLMVEDGNQGHSNQLDTSQYARADEFGGRLHDPHRLSGVLDDDGDEGRGRWWPKNGVAADSRIDETGWQLEQRYGGLMLKIYQNLKLMHTTKLLCPITNCGLEKYVFPMEPVLPLHGDILIACYLRPDLASEIQEIIFRIQFHTCSMNMDKFTFYKHDLDEACKDNRFPPTGCIELFFSSSKELMQEHLNNIRCCTYVWASTDDDVLAVAPKSPAAQRPFPSLRPHSNNGQIEERRDGWNRETSLSPPPLRLVDDTAVADSPQLPLGQTDEDLSGRSRMWRDLPSGQAPPPPVRPGARPQRQPLIRQTSDPITSYAPPVRGRSLPPSIGQLQTIDQSQLAIQGQSSGDRLVNLLVAALNQSTARPLLNRLTLSQLQTLHQCLAHQLEQQLISAGNRQLQSTTGLDAQQRQLLRLPQPPDPSDSGVVYATVQKPSSSHLSSSHNPTILLQLLDNVQRAINTHLQPTASLRPFRPNANQLSPYNVVPLQPPTGPPHNQQSIALSNLVRALLPVYQQQGQLSPDQPFDRLLQASSSSSSQQPPLLSSSNRVGAGPLATTITTNSLQLTSQGLAYVPQGFGETGKPSSSSTLPSVMDSDLERLYLQLLTARNSASLQAHPSSIGQLLGPPIQYPAVTAAAADSLSEPLLVATDPSHQPTSQQGRRHEQLRQLIDELREAQSNRSALLRQSASQPSRQRPLSGRQLALRGGHQQTSSRPYQLRAIGRSGSADAARYSTGSDFYPSSDPADEDAALLAMLEHRLAQLEDRADLLASDQHQHRPSSLSDIPVKVVGPHHRSGHVVDGSSQAISSDFGMLHVFLPSKQVQEEEPTQPNYCPFEGEQFEEEEEEEDREEREEPRSLTSPRLLEESPSPLISLPPPSSTALALSDLSPIGLNGSKGVYEVETPPTANNGYESISPHSPTPPLPMLLLTPVDPPSEQRHLDDDGDMHHQHPSHRGPRIHLEGFHSDTGTGGGDPRRYNYPSRDLNLPNRYRAFSGSPTMQHPWPASSSRDNERLDLHVPSSPGRFTRGGRYWGQSTSYEDGGQHGRYRYYGAADSPLLDQSPSPGQPPSSSRLLRSPLSPPSVRGQFDRRSNLHPPSRQRGPHYHRGLHDAGSQSDTGLHPRLTTNRRGRRYGGGDGIGPTSPLDLAVTTTGPPTEHVPEQALMVLNRLSASAHIWYQPDMSRSQSIDLLRAEPPGTFVVRNSGSFPRSFGLVVKVPPSQQPSTHHSGVGSSDSDSVRHYLIEGMPTLPNQGAVGVSQALLSPSTIAMPHSALSVVQGRCKLRGSANEPIFTNLVSLLYEHTRQSLALPCTLRLPIKLGPGLGDNTNTGLPSLMAFTSSHVSPSNRFGPSQQYRHHQHPSHIGYSLQADSPRTRYPLDQHRLTRHPSDPLPPGSDMFTLSGTGPHQHRQHQQLPPGQLTPTGRRISPQPSHYEVESGGGYHHRPHMATTGSSGSNQQVDISWQRCRAFTSIYLGSIDTENLTGSSAIRKAVDVLLDNIGQVKQTEVTLRVAHDGITLTDNWRKLFFRRHYPFYSVSYAAVDPEGRCWDLHEPLRGITGQRGSRIFGFVARKQNMRENMCHVLCDLPEFGGKGVSDYIMQRLAEY